MVNSMYRYGFISLIGFLVITLCCGERCAEKTDVKATITSELGGDMYYLLSEGWNKQEIFSYDLEKRRFQKGGYLEVGNVRDAEMSRDGRFFFYAGIKGGDSVVGILERGTGNALYDHKAEIVIEEGDYPRIIYDDWSKKLYVVYTRFVEPVKMGPEPLREPSDAGKVIYVRKHGHEIPVEEYGVVDMASAPYAFEFIGPLDADPVAISKKYFYVTKEIKGRDCLLRINKVSGVRTRLFTLPPSFEHVIILNGEEKCIVNNVGTKEEGYPRNLFLVSLARGADESYFEKPAFELGYDLFLTQLQAPDGSGIVLEARGVESKDGRYVKEVKLLNLRDWTLQTLFEFSYADTIPTSGTVFWLYQNRDIKSREGSSWVNNFRRVYEY